MKYFKQEYFSIYDVPYGYYYLVLPAIRATIESDAFLFVPNRSLGWYLLIPNFHLWASSQLFNVF